MSDRGEVYKVHRLHLGRKESPESLESVLSIRARRINVNVLRAQLSSFFWCLPRARLNSSPRGKSEEYSILLRSSHGDHIGVNPRMPDGTRRLQ
jgi:hypothetical protein